MQLGCSQIGLSIIVRCVFNEEFVGCIEPENTTYLQFQQILCMRALSDSSKNFPHRTDSSKHPCALRTVVHLLYQPSVKPLFQNPGYCTFSLSCIV